MTAESRSKSERQQDQQRLVEEALKQPGVAAAMAVFGAVRGFVPPPDPRTAVRRVYGTGGNAA